MILWFYALYSTNWSIVSAHLCPLKFKSLLSLFQCKIKRFLISRKCTVMLPTFVKCTIPYRIEHSWFLQLWAWFFFFYFLFRRLRGSLKDEKKKKFVTGEWFHEAKAKRFQEDLEGPDLLRVSIKKKQSNASCKYWIICSRIQIFPLVHSINFDFIWHYTPLKCFKM